MYKFKFHEEAKKDLIKLNKSIQNIFAKKLKTDTNITANRKKI